MNEQRKIRSVATIASRYEVHGLLGTGSYGKVMAAFDRVTKKPVAIKQVNKLFNDLIDCKRVLREICILNRLPPHKNVVRLLDIIIENSDDLLNFNELYIVLDISDSDLRKLIKQNIYLSELHALTLIYNLLCGLKFIHEAGIYHRDLKPANCLVNQNCVIKICDFGLARTVSEPIKYELNDINKENNTNLFKKQLTSHVVTRWYRAPELILLESNYTEKIDVWSVGCIFAELLDMIEGNCEDYRSRCPLFPGKKCFPLSPDAKEAEDRSDRMRVNKDQLTYIFDFLGTPSEEDLELISRDDAKVYTKMFEARESVNFYQRYPACSSIVIDLLSKLLIFNWEKRCTVLEAIMHPAFDNIRNEADLLCFPEKINMPFNDWQDMTASQLRYSFIREARKFRELYYPSKLIRELEVSDRLVNVKSYELVESDDLQSENDLPVNENIHFEGLQIKPQVVWTKPIWESAKEIRNKAKRSII